MIKIQLYALREIASENIKVPDLTESAVYKLRKHVEQVDDTSDEDEEIGDEFSNLYKGEISKSGTPILPSKRARKIPEKIQVSKQDLDELKGSTEDIIKPSIEPSETSDETVESEVSLDQLAESETAESDDNIKDTEATNS